MAVLVIVILIITVLIMVKVLQGQKESEFEWKIENFSLNKECYRGPIFRFQRESWNLMLSTSPLDNYMRLYLWKEPSDSRINVDISVALKTLSGLKCLERSKKGYFDRLNDVFVINRWISRLEFISRQKEFLSSGCLTIVLKMRGVEYLESKTANAATENRNESSHNWSQNEYQAETVRATTSTKHDKIFQDFKQLLLNQEHTDVVIRVKGKEFPAHKAILVARSPVFASTFRHKMKENETGIIDIEDCDPAIFSDFLGFLYSNDMNNLSGENVFGLFTIADKYNCPELRTKCLHFIKESLSAETFCKALALALLDTEPEMLPIVTNFFIKNAKNILETVEWQRFVEENPTYSNELFISYVNSTMPSNS